MIGDESGVLIPFDSQIIAILVESYPYVIQNLKYAIPYLSVNSIVLQLSIYTLAASAFAFSSESDFVARLPKNYEGRSDCSKYPVVLHVTFV